MNESKVLLFKKVCYDVGTRFSFVVNGKIVETVISDVMIDYHNYFSFFTNSTSVGSSSSHFTSGNKDESILMGLLKKTHSVPSLSLAIYILISFLL